MNQQVRAAKAVLACWSPGAAASEWVRAEATIGRQRNAPCACVLETCELTPPFNLVHAEDLRSGALTGENRARVKLVDQLGALTGRPGIGEYLSADAAGVKVWPVSAPKRSIGRLRRALAITD
nr:toll/interleukin-1 receptor domain-containing protein [Candidatus Viadribacter manganicus]